MDGRKVIVHFSDTLCIGGKENVVLNICNGLDKNKYKVYLIVLSDDNLPQLVKVQEHINLIILPFSERAITGLVSLFFVFKGVKYLTTILKKINPEIIHTHTTFYRLFYIFLAIKLSSIKCQQFHTVHTSGTIYDPVIVYDKAKLYIERKILKLCRPKIVAVSELAKEKCLLYLKNCYIDLTCIPNGINIKDYVRSEKTDARSLWQLSRSDLVLVYVSRLCAGKSHLTLLKAISLLKTKVPNIKLCLVGDGKNRSMLEDYVRTNSLENYVVFLGSTDKVKEILSVSDIGVFPSEYEGMSIALLEMMASSLPIVCSDIPAFRNLFSDPGTAIFFGVNDYISLSEKLEDICGSQEIRNEMGKKSREIAEKYSVEKMIELHDLYYNQ